MVAVQIAVRESKFWQHLGEEFAGPEKLGLAPKVLQSLWVSAEPFFNQRIAKGAGGKGPRQKRQKSSKSVKKCFETFRQFSRRAKSVKNRQKVSKIFSTLFDNFHAAPVFRPLLGGSDSTGVLCAKRSAQPSCRTPKVPQNSEEPLRARTHLLRTGFFSSQYLLHINRQKLRLKPKI